MSNRNKKRVHRILSMLLALVITMSSLVFDRSLEAEAEEAADATEYVLKKVEANNLVSGEQYIFVSHNDLDDTISQSRGKWALSSANGGTENTRNYIKFDSAATTFQKDIIWTVEVSEDGYSFQSADGGQYLNYVKTESEKGVYMGEKQTFTLESYNNAYIIKQKIEETEYYTRYSSNGGKPGWVLDTLSDRTKTGSGQFDIYELNIKTEEPEPDPEPTEEFGLVKVDTATETLKVGETYIFTRHIGGSNANGPVKTPGIYAVSSNFVQSTKVLQSSIQSEIGTDSNNGWLVPAAFDAEKAPTKDIAWTLATDEKGGYVLRSAESGKYLTILGSNKISVDGMRNNPESALDFTYTADGIQISKTVNGTKFNVRLFGNTFHFFAQNANADTFTVYRVTGEWPEEETPTDFSLTYVPADELKIGETYIFKWYHQLNPVIGGTGKGYGNWTLSCTPTNQWGTASVALMDAYSFNYTTDCLKKEMAFIVEPGVNEEGYALRSVATGQYLNMSSGYLTLGDIQTLNFTVNESKRLTITRNVNDTIVKLVWNGDNGGGWMGQINNNPANGLFELFRVNGEWPEETTEEFGTKWVRAQDMELGKTYAFAFYTLIESTDKGTGKFALSSAGNGWETPQLREHIPFENTAASLTEDIAWVLEVGENGEGYALRSLDTDKYLNITAEGNFVNLTLGDKQTLEFTYDKNNRLIIGKTINGTYYNVRFTQLYGNGWQAAEATSTRQFNVYEITGKWPELPDEETVRETPVMTIAAFSDFHIDYDQQNQERVMREKNLEILNKIKEQENPDVVLIGGDSTSDNGKKTWTEDNYKKATEQLTTSLNAVSDTVLYVNGNHDYQAGGTVFNSGSFIDEAMKANVGAYEDVLYESADRKSNLLAYHYVIDGIHFVGLNTPYNGDGTVSGNVYTTESVEWVGTILEKIGKEEIIIFMSHYMLADTKGITAGYEISNVNGANDRLKELLLDYPNLIHVYGHDHGGDDTYIHKSTFERVTPYETDGSVQSSSKIRAGSFTSSFMGSMSYYNNQYNEGALSAEQPKIVQALMIYVYADRVELEMKNYGESNGERKNLYSYSIPVLKEIASDVYTVAETYVTDVAHQTTVKEFVADFHESDEIYVLDFQGNVITDTDRIVRTGMKVIRKANDIVYNEKTIRVNKAADDGYPYLISKVHMTSGEKTVYAFDMAERIVSVDIVKKDRGIEKGILFTGLYGENGEMLLGKTTEITESGNYELQISMADYPEAVEYRMYMVDSMDSMTALSDLETSEEEYWLLEGMVSTDASNEMIACLDQKGQRLVVYDLNAENWNDEEASVVWEWKPTEENWYLGSDLYTAAVDAKLRYSDFYGGYVVVTAAGGGNFVGVIDYKTGESLYSRSSTPENNVHAIELLPDGNIVAASTNSSTITIYAASTGNGNGYYKQYDFNDAHGLVWDPDLEVLWALGKFEVRAYKIGGTTAEPELILQENMRYNLPKITGHDLYPVYGSDHLMWVTTVQEVYQFNTRTGEFTTEYEAHEAFTQLNDFKGIGTQPFSETIVAVHPDEAHSSQSDYWNSHSIDLYKRNEDGTYTHETRTSDVSSFYKVRAWYPNYK